MAEQEVPGTQGLIRIEGRSLVNIPVLKVHKLLVPANGLQIGQNTTDTISFLGQGPVARGSLTTQLTTLTHTAPGGEDFAVQDFVDSVTGAWAWKSHDEANTVLKVIANLQTRLGELETLLKAHGILT